MADGSIPAKALENAELAISELIEVEEWENYSKMNSFFIDYLERFNGGIYSIELKI